MKGKHFVVSFVVILLSLNELQTFAFIWFRNRCTGHTEQITEREEMTRTNKNTAKRKQKQKKKNRLGKLIINYYYYFGLLLLPEAFSGRINVDKAWIRKIFFIFGISFILSLLFRFLLVLSPFSHLFHTLGTRPYSSNDEMEEIRFKSKTLL